MSTSESRTFIQQYMDAMNGKDKSLALINQYISDSDEALKQHILDFEGPFPSYKLITEDLIAEGDKVVLRFNLNATHRGNFMGIAATGKEVNIPGIIIYRVAKDQSNKIKIVEHWMHIDAAAMMQQLGVQA